MKNKFFFVLLILMFCFSFVSASDVIYKKISVTSGFSSSVSSHGYSSSSTAGGGLTLDFHCVDGVPVAPNGSGSSITSTDESNPDCGDTYSNESKIFFCEGGGRCNLTWNSFFSGNKCLDPFSSGPYTDYSTVESFISSLRNPHAFDCTDHDCVLKWEEYNNNPSGVEKPTCIVNPSKSSETIKTTKYGKDNSVTMTILNSSCDLSYVGGSQIWSSSFVEQVDYPGTETSCSDRIDNDCDGKIDCEDEDCPAKAACTVYSDPGSPALCCGDACFLKSEIERYNLSCCDDGCFEEKDDEHCGSCSNNCSAYGRFCGDTEWFYSESSRAIKTGCINCDDKHPCDVKLKEGKCLRGVCSYFFHDVGASSGFCSYSSIYKDFGSMFLMSLNGRSFFNGMTFDEEVDYFVKSTEQFVKEGVEKDGPPVCSKTTNALCSIGGECYIKYKCTQKLKITPTEVDMSLCQ